MASFPGLNLGRGVSSLSARGPRLGAPPRGPSLRGTGSAALHAGGLSHPSVGSAGSALLGLAGNLSQPPAASAAPTAAQTQQATGAGGASPLDSTYWANVNQYLFDTNNKINADQAKIGTADTSLQNTLGQLAYQQPRDALALEQKANAGGGLFSSVYGQRQGDLQHSYTTRQTAAQQAHDSAVNALAAEIAGLQQGIPLYEAGQAAASVQRAATAAQNNPALGESVPATPAPATPAAPAAPGTPGGGVGSAGSALLQLAGNLSKGKAPAKGKSFGRVSKTAKAFGF